MKGDLNRSPERPVDKRKKTGAAGERAAAEFLIQEGYTIVERNWRCRTGEIDIVAKSGNVLVFVEVRSRNALSSSFGTPAESVDYRKINQVRKTAQTYLHLHGNPDSEMRFDVIAVLIGPGPAYTLEHLQAAF